MTGRLRHHKTTMVSMTRENKNRHLSRQTNQWGRHPVISGAGPQTVMFSVFSDFLTALRPRGLPIQRHAIMRKTGRSSSFKASKSLHRTLCVMPALIHTLSDRKHRHRLLPNTAPCAGLAVNCRGYYLCWKK